MGTESPPDFIYRTGGDGGNGGGGGEGALVVQEVREGAV